MASDLIKFMDPLHADWYKELAARPASAVDLTHVWDAAPKFDLFSPENIKAAGGTTKLFDQYFNTRPAGPAQETFMLSGRRMGKSMLTREYMKLMQEDADKITQGASRISGASMTFASMDEYESMTDEKIESKIAALRKMQGLEGEDMAKSKTGAPAISPEAVFALEELARSMTERLRDMPPLVKRVTLSRPGQLTVLRKAGYGKKPHLGGEEFEMTGVRVGSPQKGSRMIFEFKPTSVAEYDTMEMAQMECESSLNDWRLAVDRAVGGNFYMALEEVRNIDAAKLHEEERKRLAQEYQEFGAW